MVDEYAPFTDWLKNLPQYILPKKAMTGGVYLLTRIRMPWLKNLIIQRFISAFNVNMDEALEPDYRNYTHFNAFFTRALKPDARPVCHEGLCCPVDGMVSQAGAIREHRVLQAKGRDYSLVKLLGGDELLAEQFHDGQFATLYLSPRDYHRIHMPCTGTLRKMVHIPGKLFSVSPLTARMVPDLFARNERLVTLFDTDVGPMAMILVGAVNVASMETVWAGTITPPLAKSIKVSNYDDGSVVLQKGEEMGRFNMGSTVIVLFGKGVVAWDSSIQPGASVRMGQLLAKEESRSWKTAGTVENATVHHDGEIPE